MIARILTILAVVLVLGACSSARVPSAFASPDAVEVAPTPPACVTIAAAPTLTPHPTSPMAGGSTLAVALAALPSILVAVGLLIAVIIPWWRFP